YGMRQHFSIRKYHFGAASVLLGMSLALGAGGQAVKAEETVASSEALASTTATSSTQASSEVVPATSVETAATETVASTTPAATTTEVAATERTATINYIVQYLLEDGTLVEAVVKSATVTTTDATAKTTVDVTAELPEGYVLAEGQEETSSYEITEGAENLVVIKVVKKAEARVAPASTSLAIEAASVAMTPVAEAKVVLEQVTSEAEVLATEAERLVAASDSDNAALKSAAATTKLTATEATAVLNDSVATLEQVNTQIDAVRTNVEALALELRKFLGIDVIEVALTTTTETTTTTSIDVNNPNSAGYAQHGVWEIPDPVKAANSGLQVADQPATITEADKNYPAGYSGDQDKNRDTFLIYNLDTTAGYGDGNNFNDWVGHNYYITFSVSTDKAEREANDVIYAKLVEKTANGDNVVNAIQLTPGVKNNFNELKVLEGDKEHKTAYSFLYTVQTNNGGTTRNLSISNTNGNNQNTHLYNKLEAAKVGTEFNSSDTLVPGTTTQTTTYYVKENADTDRPREMLAKYTQTGGLVGDKFHIAGPIDFDNYELISSELPTVTSGALASDYVKGTQWIVLRGNYNEARLLTITDEDGSLQYQMYMLDPQNPNWANFYKANMANATIADFKEYFKLMFTSEVIAPGNKNTKEGIFSEKFYEANKLVLENTVIQVFDKNGDVLGTLSDDKTKINVPNGKSIPVANTTDTMVTDVNGNIYTVNHHKVYKTDASGNYVDADGNVLTPIKWSVDAPQRKVNGKFEIYPGYGTVTPFTTDTVTVETGPWEKTDMTADPESVWYLGWNYHTAADETRLTDSEVGKTAWDFGGLEMSMPNNNLKNEQHVRYWYSEKGGVEVYYITSDGTILEDFTSSNGTTVADKNIIVDHGDTNSSFDTTTVRYESITAADGTLYYYKEIDTTTANQHPVVNDTIDKDYRVNEKIDVETGTIKTDTVKQITYVYEKAGNVIVNYVTEDGTPLSGTTDKGTPTESTVDDTKDGKPGTDYNTNDLKPETITTADGKTYKYKEIDSAKAQPTGQVEAGVTKEVTYVYEEVKGNVVVKYVDVNGNPISGTADKGVAGKEKEVASEVEDTPLSSTTNTGNGYDTTDNRPNTITTADGKIYKLVPAATQGKEEGDIVEGTTTVTYVYELLQGDVVVHYVDTKGNTIAKDVTDTQITDTGTAYNTKVDNKPEKIVNDETGKTYYILPIDEVKQGSAPEEGKVVEGTSHVTYVYQEAGNVVVHYELEDGTPLLEPVKDVENGKPGDKNDPADDYTTTDRIKETITTADGKVYKRVPEKTKGNETGDVEAGQTIDITYIYEEVKSDVIVEYYDTDGTPISGTETGGATSVVDTEDASVGTIYNTDDKKPEIITTADGKVYYYKEVKSDSAPTTGKVADTTTTVKYVYEQAGSVTVNYVTTDGIQIKAPVKDEENAKPGKTYSTEDNRPETITTDDGKTYRLVPEETTGEENGTVTSGEDKQVTYVYEEVKGTVVVNYIDTEGNVIKAPVTDTPSTSTGTAYDTTDNKPTTITTEDGTTYELVPVLTKGSETGKVVEGETVVTYVYRKVVTPTPDVKTGSVVIRYVEAGNESNVLKDSVLDENAVATGTKYDTTDEGDKPTEIVKDGVRYVLVPSKTTV
ncbi:TPA: MucBP domain-containing protein, partial [Streptococcus suis]